MCFTIPLNIAKTRCLRLENLWRIHVYVKTRKPRGVMLASGGPTCCIITCVGGWLAGLGLLLFNNAFMEPCSCELAVLNYSQRPHKAPPSTRVWELDSQRYVYDGISRVCVWGAGKWQTHRVGTPYVLMWHSFISEYLLYAGLWGNPWAEETTTLASLSLNSSITS